MKISVKLDLELLNLKTKNYIGRHQIEDRQKIRYISREINRQIYKVGLINLTKSGMFHCLYLDR